MYRVFFFRYDEYDNMFHITYEFVCDSLQEALDYVVFDDDSQLWSIDKDIPFGDNECLDVTCLQTVARSAAMRAKVNIYFSRW